MKFIEKWLMTDAKWYQFWMPQSGSIGGCILGLLIVITVILIPMFI